MASGRSNPQPAVQQLESRIHLSGKKFVHTSAVLSNARWSVAATTLDDQALFAGGATQRGESDLVDVYDGRTAQWSTAKLSTARGYIGATTVGTNALFAGGGNGIVPTDIVDVYNSATRRWSTAKLSQGNTPSAAVTVGTKALFAGSQPLPSTRVEIYDGVTGRWSTTELSQARYSPVGTAVGSKAFLAGGNRADGRGFSNVVDIYDGSTDRWSTATLPVAASFDVATTVGTKAIFAGGLSRNKHGSYVDSDLVEIYDVKTNRWSIAALSQARSGLAAASIGGKAALFAGGKYDDRHGTHASAVVDIYDSTTGEWSVESLASARALMAGTTVGNTAIFAGGYDPGSQSIDNESAAVDLFTLDNAAPTSQLVAAPTLDHSMRSYTFTVSYHDRNGIERSTFDNNDVFVTGPNGFNHAASFLSQTRGKHASTRIVTYSVRGRGLRWDAGENGTYTIRLHGNQVTDTAGNAATGDDLGEFTVAIPTASPPSGESATVQRSLTAFQAKRKISDLLKE